MFAKIIGVVGVQCQGETSLSHFLTAMRNMHGHAISKMCMVLFIILSTLHLNVSCTLRSNHFT